MGRRIEKISPTTTSLFAYDGENLIEETNSSGTVVARYTQTQDIDEPLAMLRSSATSFYNADGLGSVTSLSNGAGALAQTYTFDSFGKQTASSGSLTNPFQYSGRELDSETGLYYYRSRYYDPTDGRFLSEDLPFIDGVNAYSYVGNDPIDWLDSSGFSRDTYVPDLSKHGGPHVDRYNPAGQNVGRYDPDGRPLKHKGKQSPPIPNSDRDKFGKAADKVKKKQPQPQCDQPNQKSVPQQSPGPVVPILPYLPFPGVTPVIPEFPVPFAFPEFPIFAM
jgi:RHS repeat-associated protein